MAPLSTQPATRCECVVPSQDGEPFYDKHAGDLIAALSIAGAALGWYLQHRKDRKADSAVQAAEAARANREIYQRLEFASIDLFRFEAEQMQLTRPIWEPDADMPKPGTAEDNAVFNYVCQMLNLFEMAVEFRANDVLPHQVFGSWVIWFFDVSQAPGFAHYWPRARHNYTRVLRRIMDKGVELRESPLDDDARTRAFFQYVGSAECIDCPEVRVWLGEPKPNAS